MAHPRDSVNALKQIRALGAAPAAASKAASSSKPTATSKAPVADSSNTDCCICKLLAIAKCFF